MPDRRIRAGRPGPGPVEAAPPERLGALRSARHGAVAAIALALAAAAALGPALRAQALGEPSGLGPARERTTPHLRIVWHASPERLTPGTPTSLVVEVTPAPGMRVYAPGQLDYLPVAVLIAPSADVVAGPPRLPRPVEHVFAPTGERSLVYDRPFRIEVPLSLPATGARGRGAKPPGTVTVQGTFQYQACDDAVCYRPVKVPLSWVLPAGRASATAVSPAPASSSKPSPR